MAHILTWKHLSQVQTQTLLRPVKGGGSSRETVAFALGISQPEEPRCAVELDLYVLALKFGVKKELEDDQLSTLVSVVKCVHRESMEKRLPLDASFTFFKKTLLNHSVERPPFSVGVFSVRLVAEITDWMLENYYRHYKLYQYVFCNRVTMSVSSKRARDVVEIPPAIPALEDAITEEQHLAILEEERKKKEEEDRIILEEKAKAEEEKRQQKLREEYEAAIPDEIQIAVQEAVDREIRLLRESMEQQFSEQSAGIRAKIDELEQKQAS